METIQQDIRLIKHTVVKLMLIMFFMALCVLLLIGFFLWVDHVVGDNMRRVHPDEVEIRDWLREKGVRWGRTVDSERHINSVSFDGLDITTEDLKRLTELPKLTGLSLKNTNATDEFIPYINELKALSSLDIQNTKITRKGLYALDSPNLQMIAIDSNMRNMLSGPKVLSNDENEELPPKPTRIAPPQPPPQL